jgi:hypothetical protein
MSTIGGDKIPKKMGRADGLRIFPKIKIKQKKIKFQFFHHNSSSERYTTGWRSDKKFFCS